MQTKSTIAPAGQALEDEPYHTLVMILTGAVLALSLISLYEAPTIPRLIQHATFAGWMILFIWNLVTLVSVWEQLNAQLNNE